MRQARFSIQPVSQTSLTSLHLPRHRVIVVTLLNSVCTTFVCPNSVSVNPHSSSHTDNPFRLQLQSSVLVSSMAVNHAFITAAPTLFSPKSHPLRRPRVSSKPIRRPSFSITPSLSAATPGGTLSPSPPTRPPTVPISIGNVSLEVPGRTLLSLVPLLMATFVACAKLLYILPVALSPALFNASRLVIASLFFLPLLVRELSLRSLPRPRPRQRSFLTAGAELGAIMFVANFLQILGLQYTDASRAAFLQQLSTVLVPIAAAGLGIESLTPRVALGAAAALAGVALLTLNAPAVVAGHSLRWLGDLLEIISAVLITAYMLRTSQLVKATGKPSAMVAVKVITQASLSLLWLLGRSLVNKFSQSATQSAAAVGTMASWSFGAIGINLLLVVWAGVLVSAATSWLQTKGQQEVPASEAAILFAAQPLWASFIATALFGERLGSFGMAGAGMIVVGTVVSGTGKRE